ncbi:hypothetical protein GOL97_17160 [Sinorhizobium medicae]|nr:hypothetical protein [Sinorhizobium medicae]
MTISYGRWQSYPWKNELALQEQRLRIHLAEMLSDEFEGEHSPWDMLDRALVLAAFATRRMFEKRLVTDKLAAEKIKVRIFKARRLASFRPPFIGESGGGAFRNYDLERTGGKSMRINDVANEIIHSSQIMVVHHEEKIPAGLLIASDWNLKDRVLHFTIEEFSAMVRRVLDDRVKMQSEEWDSETGEVKAVRL